MYLNNVLFQESLGWLCQHPGPKNATGIDKWFISNNVTMKWQWFKMQNVMKSIRSLNGIWGLGLWLFKVRRDDRIWVYYYY